MVRIGWTYNFETSSIASDFSLSVELSEVVEPLVEVYIWNSENITNVCKLYNAEKINACNNRISTELNWKKDPD